MDKNYLSMIRRQTPLPAIFQRYRVNYYIGANHEKEGNCYLAVAPKQAGPECPKSRGEICEDSVARFIHFPITALLFNVADAPAGALRPVQP